MGRSLMQAGVAGWKLQERPDAGTIAKRGEQPGDGEYLPPADLHTHRGAQPQHAGFVGGAIRRVHLAAQFMARSTAVVVHWFRAGQLAGDDSVELARWTGARR